jgi:1-acyl-sn-glycerol-3-phosphate acyltransferase
VTRWLRLMRVGAHLVAGCALSALVYPLLGVAARRAVRREWSQGLLDILDVRVAAALPPLAPGTLLVCNHVSWLDPVVLNAWQPVDIVAKSDARAWPLIGGLMARNDTIFTQRRANRSLLGVVAEIAARLKRGDAVAAFPEGTTSDGAAVLPFRTALFECAARAARPVRALALAYRDAEGRPAPAAAFIDDMSLWESVCAISARPGLKVEVANCGEWPAAGRRRRELARVAHAAVAVRVASSPRHAQHAGHLAHGGAGALELREVAHLE